MKLKGYAAVFNSDSENLGGFVERIAPGAFAGTLRQQDQVLLNGHDSGKPLARVSAGNLQLSEDDTGLRFSADLPDTPGGQELHGIVNGRVVIQMSFGFSVSRAADEVWEEGPDGLLIRTLKRVSLMEISPVTFPAYAATSVSAGDSVSGKRSAPSKAKAQRKGGTAVVSRSGGPLPSWERKRIQDKMKSGINARDPIAGIVVGAR
ncbi:HK97 family phage prohead protease [Halovibrio salipaludis]|uniref:HK97 family phage prohead protease n=1 Tax=Halovibrio salipaludis TaxID=2032626 RepID=UPI0013047278|nr:HK97 family phage prohead protease [Halovibrio salipaludis]